MPLFSNLYWVITPLFSLKLDRVAAEFATTPLDSQRYVNQAHSPERTTYQPCKWKHLVLWVFRCRCETFQKQRWKCCVGGLWDSMESGQKGPEAAAVPPAQKSQSSTGQLRTGELGQARGVNPFYILLPHLLKKTCTPQFLSWLLLALVAVVEVRAKGLHPPITEQLSGKWENAVIILVSPPVWMCKCLLGCDAKYDLDRGWRSFLVKPDV